jgi:protein-S-isoprenylcysteine O-methyltransferase Ste14
MDKLVGFLSPVIVYILIFILNAGLPGRWVVGYVKRKDSGEKLRYRLNGIPVLFTVIVTWAVLCYLGIIGWDWFYEQRWSSLAGAITFGLFFSFAIVLPFPAVKRSFVADFFFGRLENPQLWGGRVDAKMWLYLAGAIMLELNILSFAAHHHILFGDQSSPGIFLATVLLSFFVIDYITFEEVHLYTYDFFAERTGFKLGWGCIAFYPFFYSIPIWSATELPAGRTPSWMLIVFSLVFFSGWVLSRGANLQKYYFKKDPSLSFFGIRPEVITDGNRSLLVNGFWGLSRHINYLGEITMAVGIVLCTGYPMLPWPWLYPVYYILLLFTRQFADDKRCALKYEKLWEEYVKKVPYRIIPYIY